MQKFNTNPESGKNTVKSISDQQYFLNKEVLKMHVSYEMDLCYWSYSLLSKREKVKVICIVVRAILKVCIFVNSL